MGTSRVFRLAARNPEVEGEKNVLRKESQVHKLPKHQWQQNNIEVIFKWVCQDLWRADRAPCCAS